MRCGIEFEYLIVDAAGAEPGRIRDFSNLSFACIGGMLDDKPGRDDPSLATGDLGIKSGYWYLEGDERFHPDGRFRTLEVKGVEIRTPPADSVEQAMALLLTIETQLTTTLLKHGLALAIAGFNPVRPGYDFIPPLNPWEQTLRKTQRAYDGSGVSTLSYGPDINLSLPGWSARQSLDAARKLNWYSPYIVPFSFSSPFFAGQVWPGCSKRSYERAGLRPAVKLFFDEPGLNAVGPSSRLVYPARLPPESGRIEFKAFDALPSRELLAACCHLLEGICLADDLPKRSEHTDRALYQRAALAGFNDEHIRAGAGEALSKAKTALRRAGRAEAASALAPLEALLAARSTPADALLAAYRQGGPMFKPGGFVIGLCPAWPGYRPNSSCPPTGAK